MLMRYGDTWTHKTTNIFQSEVLEMSKKKKKHVLELLVEASHRNHSLGYFQVLQELSYMLHAHTMHTTCMHTHMHAYIHIHNCTHTHSCMHTHIFLLLSTITIILCPPQQRMTVTDLHHVFNPEHLNKTSNDLTNFPSMKPPCHIPSKT